MYKLLVINFLVLVFFNFAHPVTPEMLILKDAPDFLNGFLFAMMSLATFIASPYFGHRADQKGPKNLLIIGPFGYGISQLGFAYFQSTFLMSVFRLFAGIFAAAFIVSLIMYVNYVSKPEDKIKNFGLVMVTNALGGVIGQLIAGYIGKTSVYLPFIIQFLATLLLSIIIFFTIENFIPVTKNNRKYNFKDSYRLLKEKHLLEIVLAMTMMSIAFTMYVSNIGFYVTEIYGFNSLQVAYLNSYTNIIVMFANLLLIGILVKKFGTFKTFGLKFMVAIIFAIFVVFILDGFILRVICVGIFIASISMFQPLTQKIVVTNNDDMAGIMVGIVNAFNSLGKIIGSIGAGFLYAITPNLPFYIIIITLIIGVLILFRGKKNVI